MRWTILSTIALLAPAMLTADPAPVFEKDVLPLLQAKCGACHGPKVRTAGLDLHEFSLVLRGSENGPVLQKGAAEASVLYKRVKEGSMPPGKDKLTAAELEVVRRWIDGGLQSETKAEAASPASVYRSVLTAKDRQFWSFRPLSRPAVPEVRQSRLAANAVDSFLLEKLEGKGLSYSKPARKEILVRRAYLDLLGLPPTPFEVDAFVSDSAPGAWERLIDRLLASPHFGERWGRHWLDLAGYVDTIGRDVQAVGYKVGDGRWRYRDYVIRAYQQDKPYHEFLLEQIAGDELFDWRKAVEYSTADRERLIATGFLRTAEDPTDNPERDTPLLRYEVLHQTVDIVTSSVMGLTVGCARCHDHKFDPIPQRDYYRIMATLEPAYNPVKWTPVPKRILADVPPARAREIDRHNAGLEAKIKPLRRQLEEMLSPFRNALVEEKLQTVAEADRTAARKALLLPPAKRNNNQKQLVAKLGDLDLSLHGLAARMPAAAAGQSAELEAQIRKLEGERQGYGVLECLYDEGPAPESFIHRRGDFESRGLEVGPGGLEVLSPSAEDLRAEPPYEGTTGRRLALGRWLTAEQTPASALVSRVYVNRAWMHLFGQGLVATVENFGAIGSRPTHPELLEWLAAEFQANGWRTKPLIKLLMMTRAYRQSSLPGNYDRAGSKADPVEADPQNDLLWRMRLRRLESEAIRDSMLAVSGKLNRKIGGPPIKTVALPDGMVLIDEKSLEDPEDKYRRSLYLAARRRYNLSLMNVFDHPVMSTNATRRDNSAVVLQSLMMMNDAEVLAQARAFAERVQRETDEPRRLDLAFRYAFGRAPDAEERKWSAGLYARERDRYLHAGKAAEEAGTEALAGVCHVLLNANEFLYVE